MRDSDSLSSDTNAAGIQDRRRELKTLVFLSEAAPDRKCLFEATVYTHRFGAERRFAWIDKFKALLVRFERKDAAFFGLHCLAFALVNLRTVIS